MPIADVSGLLARARRAVVRLPYAVSFTALLAAGEIGGTLLGADGALRFTQWASTNVDRLRAEPIGPLLASPFVVDDHPLAWLVLAAAGVALAERSLGWRRTLAVTASAHVGATLLSEGIVWWRVDHAGLGAGALRQIDVGPSYVVVAALAVAAVAGPARARLAARVLLAALAVPLLDGLASLDVAAVGHLGAAGLGAAAGAVLRAPGTVRRGRNAERDAPVRA